MPNKDKKPKITNKCIVFFFVLLVAALVFAIFWFGKTKQHTQINHKLYGAFDKSAPHQKLTKKIEKSHTALIIGKESDGLDNYIEHYANAQIKKGRKVYMVQVDNSENWLIDTAKDINEKVMNIIEADKDNIDWIIISKNGATVSVQEVNELRKKYPKGKFVVATTSAAPELKECKAKKD